VKIGIISPNGLAPQLLVFILVGYIKDSSFIFGWSIVLLIAFGLTYWLICIVWAIVGVNNYNAAIEEDAKRQLDLWNRHHERDQNQFVVNINQKSSDINTFGQGIDVLNKPNPREWLKSNPGKSINDYFAKFGT
jgi:hypothetical protein